MSSMQGCAIEDTMDSGVGRQKREMWVLLISFLFSESSRTPLGVSRIDTEMSKLSLAKRHANSANQNLEKLSWRSGFQNLRIQESGTVEEASSLRDVDDPVDHPPLVDTAKNGSAEGPRPPASTNPEVPRRRERLRASDVHRRRAGGAG